MGTCGARWSKRRWAARLRPARSIHLQRRQVGLDPAVIDVAWKAQHRLYKRYVRLRGRGRPQNLTIVALARELAGFVWAIGQQVAAARRCLSSHPEHRDRRRAGNRRSTRAHMEEGALVDSRLGQRVKIAAHSRSKSRQPSRRNTALWTEPAHTTDTNVRPLEATSSVPLSFLPENDAGHEACELTVRVVRNRAEPVS